jgi:DMSO reductase family type II enzyme heme b subunit
MRKFALPTAVIMGTFLFSTLSFAQSREAKKLYQRHCAACHGKKGNGQGPAAYLLFPKPRDFTRGVFKLRSTPSGSPPTDQDLLRTLNRGVPGTSMPAFDRLSKKELAGIIAYVKSFSEIFEDDDVKEPPIAIEDVGGIAPASIPEGERAYRKMECEKCHGAEGKGDGPSSANLTDDWEQPIRAYDLTRGPGMMKGGAMPRDIYRTLVTGFDGTPMPSYKDDLEPDQRWQLAYYVQSLSSISGNSGPAQPSGTPILRTSTMAVDPSFRVDDPIWKWIPTTSIPLRPLQSRDDWLYRVRVQVAVGPEMAAFRFEWNDASRDDEILDYTDFRDSLAIQYASTGTSTDYASIPFIGMGDDKDEVMIWLWKSDWQAGITKAKDNTVTAGRTINKEHEDGSFSRKPSQRRMPHDTPVELLRAKGFGAMESLPPSEQTVDGDGIWRDGVWAVVMRRSLDSARLQHGKTILFAIAAWDGSAEDRAGQKSVSEWIELIIE